MRIPDLYARPETTISFEFFPPKTDEAEAALFRETVSALKRLEPSFISVTYGAGGGTRDRTLRIVKALPDAFRYEYAGTEPAGPGLGKSGEALVKLNFTPNPAYSPPSRVEQVLDRRRSHNADILLWTGLHAIQAKGAVEIAELLRLEQLQFTSTLLLVSTNAIVRGARFADLWFASLDLQWRYQ